MVLGNHIVNPGDLARAIKVVGSRFSTGGEDGLAEVHVGANGGDEQTGFPSEGDQFVLLQSACFDICGRWSLS